MEGSVVCAARKSRIGGGRFSRPPPSAFYGRLPALVAADVAADARSLDDPLDSPLVARHARRHVVLLHALVHGLVRLAHDRADPVVDLVLVPAEVLEVLHP